MFRAARIASAILGALALVTPLLAVEPLHDWQTPEGARRLVRQAVANELKKDRETHRYLFRLTIQKPGLVQVKDNVETDDGVVARLVSVNGQPLTPQQQTAENARLERLLSDPQAWAKKRKEQEDDETRTTSMLQALPDAFLFQYEGTEPEPRGELVRLRFSPDPNYNPPSRETQVFQGMQGEMWIDRARLHLVRIDGTLFKGVNFGWGILGHLDKGGHFFVEQSPLDAERWDVTHMKLSFTGRALFFFKINIQEEESASDYRPVPQHLSLKDGIGLLEKPEATSAGGNPAAASGRSH